MLTLSLTIYDSFKCSVLSLSGLEDRCLNSQDLSFQTLSCKNSTFFSWKREKVFCTVLMRLKINSLRGKNSCFIYNKTVGCKFVVFGTMYLWLEQCHPFPPQRYKDRMFMFSRHYFPLFLPACLFLYMCILRTDFQGGNSGEGQGRIIWKILSPF